MKKKGVERVVLYSVLIIGIIFGICFLSVNVYAADSVKVTAGVFTNEGNYSSDVYLRYDPNSNKCFDKFDMPKPDSPTNDIEFYSDLAGVYVDTGDSLCNPALNPTHLSIDSRNNLAPTHYITLDNSNIVSLDNYVDGCLNISWIDSPNYQFEVYRCTNESCYTYDGPMKNGEVIPDGCTLGEAESFGLASVERVGVQSTTGCDKDAINAIIDGLKNTDATAVSPVEGDCWHCTHGGGSYWGCTSNPLFSDEELKTFTGSTGCYGRFILTIDNNVEYGYYDTYTRLDKCFGNSEDCDKICQRCEGGYLPFEMECFDCEEGSPDCYCYDGPRWGYISYNSGIPRWSPVPCTKYSANSESSVSVNGDEEELNFRVKAGGAVWYRTFMGQITGDSVGNIGDGNSIKISDAKFIAYCGYDADCSYLNDAENCIEGYCDYNYEECRTRLGCIPKKLSMKAVISESGVSALSSDLTQTPSSGGGSSINTSLELIESAPVSGNINQNKKIPIQINGQTNYVGVVKISDDSSSAVIQITGPNIGENKSLEVTIKKGEEKKMNLDEDNYYDLLIKLDDIIGETVKLTMKAIKESITGTNSGGIFGNNTSKNSIIYLWIALIAVAIIIILVILFILRKRRQTMDVRGEAYPSKFSRTGMEDDDAGLDDEAVLGRLDDEDKVSRY